MLQGQFFHADLDNILILENVQREFPQLPRMNSKLVDDNLFDGLRGTTEFSEPLEYPFVQQKMCRSVSPLPHLFGDAVPVFVEKGHFHTDVFHG